MDSMLARACTLEGIVLAMKSRVPLTLPSTQTAAVAIILRGPASGTPSSPPPSSPEALYILRSTREGDKWSGQVAFPGGRLEDGDVDEEAAAVRETMEEVGLDLRGGGYTCLGRLDDRPVTSGGSPKAGYILRPFLFLQEGRESPPLTLQPAEVAAVRWAALEGMAGPPTAAVRVPCPFPLGTRLPLVAVRAGAVVEADGATLALPAYDLPGPGPTFRLWGMSLQATKDVLALAGGP